jgi:hypothetical protein
MKRTMKTSEAKKILRKAFPNQSERDLLLAQLSDSFRYAKALAPNAVGVTLKDNGFRLNVGKVEVMTAFDGIATLVLQNPSERLRAELQPHIEPAKYKSIRGDTWHFRWSMEEFKAYREDLLTAHRKFIKSAGTTKTGKTVKGSRYTMYHSPALIAVAESVRLPHTKLAVQPMTPKQLAQRVRKLPAEPPITAEFEGVRSGKGKNRVWYSSQKEHWLGWLSAYDGPGAYGRKNWNRSADFVYNHIVCPPMVLWLGEAAGVPKDAVAEALRAARAAGPYLAAQSASIRRIITWEMIETRLNKPS